MEQGLALDLLKSGFNCMLTGQAGTGKSYTLGLFIQYLKKKKIRYAVTASTGIAASHLNGQTIHSWCGMGVKDDLDSSALRNIKERKTHLLDTAVLIIDEISMLHARQLELLDKILKYCRESEEPFGGIQIVACGDFFQLPPVEKSNQSGNQKFCFMSNVWVDAKFKICYLTKQYRQNQEGDFLTTILNEIRSGTVSEESRIHLQNTVNNHLENKNLTKLYTHNIDVDQINEKTLNEMDSKQYAYDCELNGNPALCEMIMRQSRIPQVLNYKIGALVMFTKNHGEQIYSNGTCGTIVDVIRHEEHGELPVVKTKDGDIVAEPESWSIKDESGNELASVTTLPLRLAWAITIHKSQGMTLDSAEIDLSNTFEKGQGYVALSRLRSLNGMRVLGLNDVAFEITSIVRKADMRFLELSEELQEEFKGADFKALHKAHYKKVLDKGWIVQNHGKYGNTNRKRLPPKGVVAAKNSLKTKDYIVDGVDLEKLAQEQKMSISTLIRHIALAKESDVNFDISFLKPDTATLSIIGNAVKRYLDSGKATPFFKNNPLFVQNSVRLIDGGSKIAEIDIWKASLFLDNKGEVKV